MVIIERYKPKIGDSVVFVNAIGEKHRALVIAVHGDGFDPSINLAYVSKNPNERDYDGQRIITVTSVVHRSNQSANGMYWF